MIYITKPGNTFGKFLENRARRVIPLYWFFTLLMAAILLLMPNVFKATQYDTTAMLLSLAFIPHWSSVTPTEAWPIVAPGWSLNFEMYFYFIFALSLFLAEKFRIAFISLFICAVVILAQFFDSGHSAIAYFFAKPIVFEFILGMLLAAAWKRGFRLPPSISWALLILATGALFLNLPIPRIFLYGVPALLVVTACLFIKVKEWRFGILLGDASYALYLSHIFTLGVLRKVLPPLLGEGQIAAWLFAIISLIVCTVVSLFIHKYIDNWLLVEQRLPKFGKRAEVQPKT